MVNARLTDLARRGSWSATRFVAQRLALVGAGVALAMSVHAANETTTLLQFLDGSSLHGQLGSIEMPNRVSWSHPAAASVIRFRPTNLASIKFDNNGPPPSNSSATCHFRFANGDEIYGKIASLAGSELAFETWFGSGLKAPQTSLRSLTFSSKGFNTLYEGPKGIEGWNLGKGPRPWKYQDGAFVSTGAEILGRNLNLSPSSSMAFDLAWTAPFSMSITLFAETIERFDYNTSAYIFYFGLGTVSVQRVQPGAGMVMLGQAQIPLMTRKNKMRFEIRANKEDATLALLTDGVLVHRWKDSAGLNPKGSGVVFYSQMDGQTLKLSNIRAAEWDGRFEQDFVKQPKDDAVFLINKDRAIGVVEGIRDDKLLFKTPETRLEIPMQRVSQIIFATATNTVPEPASLVRMFFSAGETVVVDLENWAADRVAAKSPNFGPVTFRPGVIRELQFNSQRRRTVDESGLPDDPFLSPDE